MIVYRRIFFQEAWELVLQVKRKQWWMSNIIQVLKEDRSPKWDALPFRQAIDLLSWFWISCEDCLLYAPLQRGFLRTSGGVRYMQENGDLLTRKLDC